MTYRNSVAALAADGAQASELPKPIAGPGRPDRYRLKDGSVVPSVTTITGRFKGAGGFIRWAYNCGRDGKDIDKERDEAASTGTLAHAMIEASIHHQPLPGPTSEYTPEMTVAAGLGFAGFLEWREQTHLEILATETPLVSELHRFGGTPDIVGRQKDGSLALLDLKSSNAIYPEYLAQCGGYVVLLEGDGFQPIEHLHLLRVGKDDGSFHHHHWGRPTIELAVTGFLGMRALYDTMALLKKAI